MEARRLTVWQKFIRLSEQKWFSWIAVPVCGLLVVGCISWFRETPQKIDNGQKAYEQVLRINVRCDSIEREVRAVRGDQRETDTKVKDACQDIQDIKQDVRDIHNWLIPKGK